MDPHNATHGNRTDNLRKKGMRIMPRDRTPAERIAKYRDVILRQTSEHTQTCYTGRYGNWTLETWDDMTWFLYRNGELHSQGKREKEQTATDIMHELGFSFGGDR